jgi:hypothetical protein
MKKLLIPLIALVLATSSTALANQPFETGFTFGVATSDFESETSGVTVNGEAGLLVGGTFYKDMGDLFSLRMGGYVARHNAEIKIATDNTDIQILTIDVPVTAMFNLSEGFGLFVGPAFSMTINDKCTGDSAFCDEFDPESFVTFANFGVHVRVHPNWAVEAFYNLGLSDVADKLSYNNAGVQASFIY